MVDSSSQKRGQRSREYYPGSGNKCFSLYRSIPAQETTNCSMAYTFLRPLLNHRSGRHARMARGRTYNAISPLRLPLSIQMLLPQTMHPAKTQPNGPSKKSCEISGSARATTRERVIHTAAQNEETKAERNEALRRIPNRVSRIDRKLRSLWGRLINIGRT